LGIVNATMNASCAAGGNAAAIKLSRTTPSTRLAIVAALTTPAERETRSTPSVDRVRAPGYLPAPSEVSMATHRSAKKRHAQSLRRRARNNQIHKTVRGAVRKLRDAKAAGSKEVPALLQEAERLLRKAASKGVMHKRTVSRTVSRLAKLSAR
jgi:small subunit ribosomal protein S20